MRFNQKRRAALNKELLAVEKQEKKLRDSALRAVSAGWKTELERRIPAKVLDSLKIAFQKGFSMTFDHGRAVIEHSYSREELQADYEIREFAVERKGGRQELRQMHRSARQGNLRNLAVTTVEGVGLGVLGIGLPDIILFLGVLLKGVYETAMNYGFDYESRREQVLILKMLETALSTGEAWEKGNAEVDRRMSEDPADVTMEDFRHQLKQTASVFAMDMLLLKFVQGLPLVGILGGAGNPVYYAKIMKYIQTKYRKRYLLGKMQNKIP